MLLERLAANLVDNAVRHNVSRLDPGDDWRAGRGGLPGRLQHRPVIPAGVADTLFEPFRRLDPTPGGPGLGLGLAIVRSVATAHDGTVSAQGRPNGGLDVSVVLPGPGPSPPSYPAP